MLVCLLWSKRIDVPVVAGFRCKLVTTSQQLIGYLSLLFVPIGVGVIMHLKLLETQLVQIIGVITIGTITTIVSGSFGQGLLCPILPLAWSIRRSQLAGNQRKKRIILPDLPGDRLEAVR